MIPTLVPLVNVCVGILTYEYAEGYAPKVAVGCHEIPFDAKNFYDFQYLLILYYIPYDLKSGSFIAFASTGTATPAFPATSENTYIGYDIASEKVDVVPTPAAIACAIGITSILCPTIMN